MKGLFITFLIIESGTLIIQFGFSQNISVQYYIGLFAGALATNILYSKDKQRSVIE